MPTTALDPTVVADPSGSGPVIASRYRLDGVIGEGAMGTVYRVLDLQTQATLAMKVLHAHIAADERLAARFEREIDAGRRLRHPSLLPVLDDGRARELGRFLVMPLLGGTDLRAEIAGGVGLRRSLALVDQLLDALAHVHALGLVHRDVKPENIRVLRDAEGNERLMLLDFGLVKPIGAKASEPRLTEHGRVFGTPWYMAPEQAMGARIDHRVDLYAVGALLFEMLSGSPPFEGSLAAVLNQQIAVPAPPLPEWVPPPIARVVAQLLEKEPDARPPTAAATAAALRAALASASSQPTRMPVGGGFTIGDVMPVASAPVSMLRSSQRQGRWLAIAFAAAAAIVGAFALSSADDDAPVAPRTEVVTTETVEAPKPAAPKPVEPMVTPAPIVKPPVVDPTLAVVVPPKPVVDPTPQPVVEPVVDPTPQPVVEPVAPKPKKPTVHKPAKPRPKPTVPKMPDEPSPPKKLQAKKPPRPVPSPTSKLPRA